MRHNDHSAACTTTLSRAPRASRMCCVRTKVVHCQDEGVNGLEVLPKRGARAHATAARHRTKWLVGSSMMRTCGRSQVTMANATRLRRRGRPRALSCVAARAPLLPSTELLDQLARQNLGDPKVTQVLADRLRGSRAVACGIVTAASRHKHTLLEAHTHTHTHAHTRTRTHTRTHAHAHTHTPARGRAGGARGRIAGACDRHGAARTRVQRRRRHHHHHHNYRTWSMWC